MSPLSSVPRRLARSREFWFAAAIVAMIGAITLRSPGFAAPANLLGIFNNTAILIILALGQTVVIVTRSIDLSMASNLALSGMLAALLSAAYPDLPAPMLIAVATGSGLALGAFNGLLVWKLDIPSIVVTLGTLTIFRATNFLVAGGQWVNADELSPGFIQATRLTLLGLPLLTWFALVIALGFFVLMTRTPLGRAIYAVGVNPVAAVYAGIDVGRTRFLTFCISGLLSGLAGFLWVSRYVIA